MLLSVVWDITALSSWFVGVNISHTGICREKRQLSWMIPLEARKGVGETECFKSLYTYSFFFFFFASSLLVCVQGILRMFSFRETVPVFPCRRGLCCCFFFLKCNQNTRVILMTFLVSGAGFFESVLSQCIPTLIFSDFSPLCYIGITFLKLIGRL